MGSDAAFTPRPCWWWASWRAILGCEMKAPALEPDVEEVLRGYPSGIRKRILDVRSVIFATAATTEGVGEVEETLKWGEPAYLTKNRSGTTIRLAWQRKHPSRYALYVHCQTNLVETFRSFAPAGVLFEGNRAVVFEQSSPPPRGFLKACITEALTYHQARRSSKKRG